MRVRLALPRSLAAPWGLLAMVGLLVAGVINPGLALALAAATLLFVAVGLLLSCIRIRTACRRQCRRYEDVTELETRGGRPQRTIVVRGELECSHAAHRGA